MILFGGVWGPPNPSKFPAYAGGSLESTVSKVQIHKLEGDLDEGSDLLPLRVHSIKLLQDNKEWEFTKKRPGKVFANHIGTHITHLAKGYGWKAISGDESEIIAGFLRVGKAVLDDLVKNSGTDGVFVERLWDDPSNRPPVEWLRRNAGEPLGDYRNRALDAARQAKVPLVFRNGFPWPYTTINWECPVCKKHFKLTGIDKAHHERTKHLALRGKKLSDFGIHSEKLKQNWKETGRPCLLGVRAKENALARAKQVQEISSHELVHAQSLGIFSAIQKTWFCAKCCARGTTRQITEMICNPDNWSRARCRWWAALASPHREAIAKACKMDKRRRAQVESIVKKGCAKPSTSVTCPKKRRKGMLKQCQNCSGCGGSFAARIELPKLRIAKRPAATTKALPSSQHLASKSGSASFSGQRC